MADVQDKKEYDSITEALERFGNLDDTGKFFESNRDYLRAADIYSRTRNPSLVKKAAEFYFQLGKYDDCIKEIKKTRGLIQPSLQITPSYRKLNKNAIAIRANMQKDAEIINSELNRLEELVDIKSRDNSE